MSRGEGLGREELRWGEEVRHHHREASDSAGGRALQQREEQQFGCPTHAATTYTGETDTASRLGACYRTNIRGHDPP